MHLQQIALRAVVTILLSIVLNNFLKIFIINIYSKIKHKKEKNDYFQKFVLLST